MQSGVTHSPVHIMIYKPHHENCLCIFEHRMKISADQRLVFATYLVKPLYFLNPSLATFCGYADQFMSDLVGNPENRLSNDAAHITSCCT